MAKLRKVGSTWLKIFTREFCRRLCKEHHGIDRMSEMTSNQLLIVTGILVEPSILTTISIIFMTASWCKHFAEGGYPSQRIALFFNNCCGGYSLYTVGQIIVSVFLYKHQERKKCFERTSRGLQLFLLQRKMHQMVIPLFIMKTSSSRVHPNIELPCQKATFPPCKFSQS